jgi:alkylated DNA repair dioxygenase AlkB
MIMIGEKMLCQTFIRTDKSFLNLYMCDEFNELIEKSVEEVKDELLHKPPLKMYGKVVHQQRDIGFFSDTSIGYYYAGQLAKSKPLQLNSSKLMNLINERFGTKYNGILVNRYVDGNNYISDHSDEEKNLDAGGVVAISYGVERKFRIKDKLTGKKIEDIPTYHNSIIHMGGDFQKEFTHGIPVEKKVKGVRYSFTFRNHTI